MTVFSQSTTRLLLSGLVGIYLLGYGVARLTVFHTVEHYPEGKGGPRQDYVTKPDLEPGQGWEYQLFWPAIKLEETVSHSINAISRR